MPAATPEQRIERGAGQVRLRQEPARAVGDGEVAVVGGVARRDDDDRQPRRAVAQVAGDLEPAHVGQPDVEQDDVRLELLRGAQGAGAVRGLADHRPSVALQRAPRRPAEAGVVVDDQHAGRHGRILACPPPARHGGEPTPMRRFSARTKPGGPRSAAVSGQGLAARSLPATSVASRSSASPSACQRGRARHAVSTPSATATRRSPSDLAFWRCRRRVGVDGHDRDVAADRSARVAEQLAKVVGQDHRALRAAEQPPGQRGAGQASVQDAERLARVVQPRERGVERPRILDRHATLVRDPNDRLEPRADRPQRVLLARAATDRRQPFGRRERRGERERAGPRHADVRHRARRAPPPSPRARRGPRRARRKSCRDTITWPYSMRISKPRPCWTDEQLADRAGEQPLDRALVGVLADAGHPVILEAEVVQRALLPDAEQRVAGRVPLAAARDVQAGERGEMRDAGAGAGVRDLEVAAVRLPAGGGRSRRPRTRPSSRRGPLTSPPWKNPARIDVVEPRLVAEDAVRPARPAAAHDVEQDVLAPRAGDAEVAALRGAAAVAQAAPPGPAA